MSEKTPGQAAYEAWNGAGIEAYSVIYWDNVPGEHARWEAAAKAAIAAARAPSLVINFDGEVTEERAAEIREALAAAIKPAQQAAPEFAAAIRERDGLRDELAAIRERLENLADDFHFERKQVVELRAVLSEVFTCLDAGDPALLDDDQVAEWRERAGTGAQS